MGKKLFLNVLIGVLALTSCKDEVITPEVEIPVQPEEALILLEEYNRNIAAFRMVAEGKVTVVEVDENGTLKFDNKSEAKFSFSENADRDIPVFGIDENGYWQYMIHGETQALKDMSGNRAAALSGLGTGVFTPKVSISKDGYWQVSFNGVEWKKLSDVIAPSLENKTAESYALFKSSSVEGKIMKVKSVVGDIEYAIQLPEDNMAEAWRRFIMNTDDNVLLDYSYAGYDHGESAPLTDLRGDTRWLM
ncbi:MAG: PL29 family lyase N-terminal domain-containing protein [Phocaeicola sp.]